MSSTRPVPAQAPARWRRLACMLYEGVLLFAVVFLVDYAFDTLTQSHTGLHLRHLRQAFLFAAIGAYFTWCWRHGGQTLPMRTWNIRVTDRGGWPLRGSRLLVRYVLLWPLPLLCALAVSALARDTPQAGLLIAAAPLSLFVWTWFDPQGQFLHDRLLGTELRDAPRRPRTAPTPSNPQPNHPS